MASVDCTLPQNSFCYNKTNLWDACSLHFEADLNKNYVICFGYLKLRFPFSGNFVKAFSQGIFFVFHRMIDTTSKLNKLNINFKKSDREKKKFMENLMKKLKEL